MKDKMNSDEYYTYEDRAYVNPTLSRDEQLGFVNTLRNTIDKDMAQINTQTKNLGTDITSNLGGLTGSNGYFQQRYKTMPVESQANTLKATAQAKALNDLMTNYQNQAANKYSQAYRNAAAKAATAGSTDDGGYNKNDVSETAELGATLDTNAFPDNGEGVYSLTPDPTRKDYMTWKDNNGNIIGVEKYVNGELKPISGNEDANYVKLNNGLWIDKSTPAYRNAVNRVNTLNNVAEVGLTLFPVVGPLLGYGYDKLVRPKINDEYLGHQPNNGLYIW